MGRKLALALALLGLAGCTPPPASAPPMAATTASPPATSQFPNFSLTDTTGKTHHLRDYQGKILVVNLWATWCPPCRAEIPDLVKVQRQYAARGVQFLGLSVDRDAGQLKLFERDQHLDYPCVDILNPEGKHVLDGLSAHYDVQGLPSTFVVDGSGRIANFFAGPVQTTALTSALELALHPEPAGPGADSSGRPGKHV